MALDCFLQLLKGGKSAVEGESLDAKFGPLKAFELVKFRLSSQIDMTTEDPAAGADEEAEQAFVLNVTKEIDSATPDLFLNYCRFSATRTLGTFDEAILTVRKAAGAKALEYLVYRLRDVYIKSWRLENADADGLPEEVIDFCFMACTVEYSAQRTAGGGTGMVQATWDFFDLSKNTVD
jgi:type VI protein secretion system component Hcp